MDSNHLLSRWGLMLVSLCGAGLALAVIIWIARRQGAAQHFEGSPSGGTGFALAAVLLAGFGLLTTLIQVPGVDETEVGFLRQVFRAGPPTLQAVVKQISDISGFAIMSGIVIVLTVAHLGLGRGRAVPFFLAVMCGELALEGIAKPLFHRARPPLHERIFFDSYPSGHTMAATILVGVLLCLWLPSCRRHWQRITLWSVAIVWTAMIGASRVYLGRHYVSDILGGVLLGAAWTVFCRGLLLALSTAAGTPATQKAAA